MPSTGGIGSIGPLQGLDRMAAAAQGSRSVHAVAETFGDALSTALERVDQAQQSADRAAEAFATGENSDVAALMLSTERAHLAMQLTLQIRNKVLEAYQEIIRMQL